MQKAAELDNQGQSQENIHSSQIEVNGGQISQERSSQTRNLISKRDIDMMKSRTDLNS